MKLAESKLREIIREIIKEEQDYQTLFKNALAKAGKGVNDMSDEEKKKFFSDIDKQWKGKNEK
jgi:hypothetical protein